jgi:hypothetical protein
MEWNPLENEKVTDFNFALLSKIPNVMAKHCVYVG